jgi:hypothetical protein
MTDAYDTQAEWLFMLACLAGLAPSS